MITDTIKQSLVDKVYELLMSDPDRGIDQMGECLDAAESLVEDWLRENNLQSN